MRRSIFFRSVVYGTCAMAICSLPWSVAAQTPDLSEVVERIVGGSAEYADYTDRLEAVRRLPREIGTDTARPILDWLMDPNGALPPQEEAAIKNDAVNRLIRARHAPGEVAQALMKAHTDKQQPAVWRDYCIQHLGTLYAQVDEPTQADIRDVLWSALNSREIAIAGTSLIALKRNVGETINADHVADGAAKLASDKSRGAGSRATALSILTEWHDARAIPPAREALTDERNVVLRLAALGALAEGGGAEDRPLIERYTSNSIGTLRQAALTSLAQMDKRLSLLGE